MENLSRVFQKQTKKTKRLSFINQFKIQFLLPFTGCRKELGKMPELRTCFQIFFRFNFRIQLRLIFVIVIHCSRLRL